MNRHTAQETGNAAANAQLIAAAPELLKALQMVDRIWSGDQTANLDPESPLAIVRAAILQATGTRPCFECGEVQVSAHEQRCSFCDPGEGKVKT